MIGAEMELVPRPKLRRRVRALMSEPAGFVPSLTVATREGPLRLDAVRQGTLICQPGGGFAPVAAVIRQPVTGPVGAVLIPRGALGPDVPLRDLVVPPAQRLRIDADALHANWLAEFDAQYERGRCFSMVLHPHLIGWCNRNRKLSQFFAHVAAHSGVWNATAGECAEYWLERYPAASHLRLAPSIWQDHEGSLS